MAKRIPPTKPLDPQKSPATVTPLLPRRILQLVRRQQDTSTVDLLKGLLAQAERGDLAGVVVVGLFPAGSGKKYDSCLAGLAAANPTLAVGAVDVCHMLLRETALQEAGLD